MKKLKARLGLKLVGFGLFIMSLGDKSEYSALYLPTTVTLNGDILYRKVLK